MKILQYFYNSVLFSRDASFFTQLSTYKTDNLDQTLPTVDMTYPYIDAEMLRNYFKHLSARGIIKLHRQIQPKGIIEHYSFGVHSQREVNLRGDSC